VIKKPTFVTQPSLPSLDDFLPYLRRIWESKIVTNSGPFHHEFEDALCLHLGVKHISVFCNGTISLVTALNALNITGEVVTTPFSYVATSHSLLWNNITPVFADIEKDSLNISPSSIEEAITKKTTAIVAVHCYGRPCKVKEIQEIAKKHNLKVIYDAAHAFGVEYESRSLLTYGDLSCLSFHATKVFNTFEGGAIVCPNADTKHYVDQLKNFGQEGEDSVLAAGINGKMSEFNAALGLLQLKHVDEAISRRKRIDAVYRQRLNKVRGIRCFGDVDENVSKSNYAYFTISVEPEYPISRDALYHKLKDVGIHPRRYFYPLISEFSMYRDLPSANPENLPVSAKVAQKVLCLPIYPDLEISTIDGITSFIAGQ
jgi:dTDP-4-amino-4,6-dideoxygalactose transaminase